MIRAITLACLCLVVLAWAANNVPGRAIVNMKAAHSIEDAQADIGSIAVVVEVIWEEEGIFLVAFSDTLDVENMVDSLRADSDVEIAQPNHINEFYMVFPNDYVNDQWSLYQSENRRDTQAPEAWEITTGSGRPLFGDTAVVAVLDQGFANGHIGGGCPIPLSNEFAENQWINYGEPHVWPFPDQIDDDGNGTQNDRYGKDLRTSDPGGGYMNCTHDGNHGNAVASIIGARGNNGEHRTGVCWQTYLWNFYTDQLLDEEVFRAYTHILNSKAIFESTGGALGFNFVAVNESWGGVYACAGTDYATYHNAMSAAGIISVCAAGNDGLNIDDPRYHSTPVGCEAELIIGVSASDQNDSRADWGGGHSSSYGAVSVDLAAPGTAIPALYRYWEGTGWNYGIDDTFGGTSAAAPHVTGAVYLLHSIPNPSFQEFYESDPFAAASQLKSMILSNVDVLAAWNNLTVTEGRLNLAAAASAMCNYYYDNGHSFDATSIHATSPSSNSNYVIGSGLHWTYLSDPDIYYVWWTACEEVPRVYKLTPNRWPGVDPCIASIESQSQTDVLMAWLSQPDGLTILEHEIAGDCTPPSSQSEAWRLARLNEPAPSGEGVVNTCPVIVAEEGTIPVVLIASSGGTTHGVHCWKAPSIQWHDFEGWEHSIIPGSEQDNITSLSAYTWEQSNEIHVTWATDDDEVHFIPGFWVDGEIDWDEDLHVVVSAGLTGATDYSNVTYCYSPDLESGVCIWEGTQTSTGRRNLYRAWGLQVSQGDNWLAPAAMFSADECLDKQSPQLHPYRDDDGAVQAGYCRVALAYEKKRIDRPHAIVECVGLMVNEQSPQWLNDWLWTAPVSRWYGKNPTVTEWSGSGYQLFYVEDGASAPYGFRTESVPLTYNVPVVLPDPDVVTTEITLSTPLTRDRKMIIADGGSVTILGGGPNCDDPTMVTFSTHSGIVVEEGGTLSIQGTEGKPIKFQSYDPTQAWGGIKVEGGTLNMDYAEVKDCDTVCVWTYKPEQVSITNCVLHGDKMVSGSSVLRLYGSPEKSQVVSNTQIMNAPYATGLYANGCDVTFENVEIKNCYANSYISSVTGNFRDCTFGGRTSKHGVMFLSTGNTPNFQCCQFEDLSPLGGSYQSTIYAMDGSAPSFGYVGLTQGASNTVSDSSVALLKMFGSGVLPIIANGMSSGPGGKNDWYQRKSSGYNLYWGSPYPKPLKQYYAEQQYWDPAPATLSDFYPSDASYFDYTNSPAKAWELCGDATSSVSDRGVPHESGLDDADPVYDSLFALAMSHEILREFALSQPLFRAIVREEDDYYLSWLAMTHAASNQRFLQDSVDGSWIVPMIDSLVGVAPDSMDYDAAVAGGRLKANFYVSIYEHEAAIDELADLLESDLTERDSLLVSLELLDAYVAAGLIEDDGSLDGTTAARVPSRLRVKSDAEAWVVEQEIVERLGQIMGNNEPRNNEPLPTEFRLYQNYPNPFNPTTQIEFDLPQSAPVTLKVFNTLGQEVTTLLDATRSAGHHVVMWNGKNSMDKDVATGLYVYQIQAGSFTAAKKMVLLR